MAWQGQTQFGWLKSSHWQSNQIRLVSCRHLQPAVWHDRFAVVYAPVLQGLSVLFASETWLLSVAGACSVSAVSDLLSKSLQALVTLHTAARKPLFVQAGICNMSLSAPSSPRRDEEYYADTRGALESDWLHSHSQCHLQ